MQRSLMLILALAALGACHKSHGTTPASGSGSGSGSSSPDGTDRAPGGRRVIFSFGTSPQGKSTDVYLAMTDERGAQTSRALGTYAGTCAPATAAPAMEAMLALDCKDGATGWELQLIDRRDRVLVLKLRLDDGVKPDPMGRDPIDEIVVPPGAGIDVAK